MDIKFRTRKNGSGEIEIVAFDFPEGDCKEVLDKIIIPSNIGEDKIDRISDTIHLSFERMQRYGVKIIKKIVVENGIKFVDSFSFSSIDIEIDEFYWPSSCEAIPEFCFEATNIKSIKGIENVKHIGNCAFCGTGLKEICWPYPCLKIPRRCFFCSHLESITGIEEVTQIEESAFDTTDFKSFTWPRSCTSIPKNCFFNTPLKEIEGIENVKHIGSCAFANTSLIELKWPLKCRRIPRGCFSGSSIKVISNINNVTNVGCGAFKKSNICRITWPDKCKIIPEDCFSGALLKEIHGMERVCEIRRGAFDNTLIKEFVWPANVISMSCSFLHGCYFLDNIIFAPGEMRDVDVYSSFLGLNLKTIKSIDLSAVTAVNFVARYTNIDYKKLYERMKGLLRLPYYVNGLE